ncbi:hypothetical protein ACP70R_019870 [Stipagrostis hirtigluma subsp. patula]
MNKQRYVHGHLFIFFLSTVTPVHRLVSICAATAIPISTSVPGISCIHLPAWVTPGRAAA